MAAAFLGAGLLLVGTALLTAETWVGVGATDLHVRVVAALCETDGRGGGPSGGEPPGSGAAV